MPSSPTGTLAKRNAVYGQLRRRRCAQAEVREPSALLTPSQSSKRAIFTCGQSMPSRKEDSSLLVADSEPSEWCGAALDVI